MDQKIECIVMAERKNLPLDVKLGRSRACLEIGFGNGEFLAFMAREDRETTWWGIEMSRACVLRARRRIEREGLSNVRLLSGDARFFLRECLAGESLDGIYMNFPCPWPKKRHSKRRVSSGSFPSEVARVLKKGAFFELFTDEEWYGREVRDGMIAHPDLEEALWQVNPLRPVRTKYERRWLEMGKSLYLSRVEKKKRSAGGDPHYLGRAEDVHVRVQRRGSAGSVLKELFGREGKDGPSLWIYKRSYSDEGKCILLETVTMDGDFEQKFYLLVVEEEEDCLVKIAPYSTPFLTPAVKGALMGLAGELERSAL